jgi:AraC-like DNA-binding protein
MQVADKKFPMKTDGFLPRYNAIECYHKPGNHLFGIKFRMSPVIFEKKVDFSEYLGYIFPLSYLLDQAIIDKIKKAGSFEARTNILSAYFLSLLSTYKGSIHPVTIVSEILDKCYRENKFTVSIEKLAEQYGISSRTLQRYFEICTGISGKQALQVMRIRKATAHLANAPGSFHYSLYGYYDHSHFYKHLKQFLQENTLKNIKPHLDLLGNLHKKEGR